MKVLFQDLKEIIEPYKMWPFLLEDQVGCQQFLHFSEANVSQRSLYRS